MKYHDVRRMPEFEYLAPGTIDEAVAWLTQYKDRVRVMAGGTDLMPKMKRREATPQYLMGLKSIPGLDYIKYDEEMLRIGPLATIHAIEVSPLIRERFPILSEAAATIGSVQIRNLGTIVGNLCSALPSADMAPGLIALGAGLKIVNAKGERTIAVEEFFKAPSESVLGSDELVTEIQIASPRPHSGMAYIKHMLRGAMDLAIISVAAIIALEDGVCRDVRIALGTAAPTPIRAIKAEGILRGKPFEQKLVEEVALAASQECKPRSSKRASTEYRREMVKVLTRRALIKARERAS